MSDLTASQEIKILERFAQYAEHQHAVGHAKAAVAAETTRKPFVAEEEWANAASRSRSVARLIRESGRTLAEALADEIAAEMNKSAD